MSKPDQPAAPVPEAATATVTLDTPIQRGDTAITTVQLRKPRAGELRGLSLNDLLTTDVNAHLKLLPRITAPTLIEPELAAMDPADFAALAGEVVAFLLPKAARESLPV